VVAYILSKQPVKQKLIGISASILLIAAFVSYTAGQYKNLTGIRQFTPFTGWQMANNAMYAYRYIDSANRQLVPEKFRTLDGMVRHYFDTSRDLKTHPTETLVASTVYMWDHKSPLQKYMKQSFKKDSSSSPLKQWASMSPLYYAYGSYLISLYPKAYFSYYLLPNMLKYYVPPGEFLDEYNMGRDTVAQIAQFWFGYKSKNVHSIFKSSKVDVLGFVPVLSGTMNLLFCLGILSLFMLGCVNRKSLLFKCLLLTLIVWLANFIFSVFASPITLRYQLFNVTVVSLIAVLAIDIVCRVAFRPDQQTKSSNNNLNIDTNSSLSIQN
jgi:hypothetical protein